MTFDCLPQVHLAAVHAAAGYSGDTLGLGVVCRAERLLIGAGFYRNSMAQHSNYGMVAYQPIALGGVRLGVFAGMVNGYSYRGGNYFPMAGLLSSLPLPIGELHMAVIPQTSVNPAVAEFSVAFKF